MPNKSKSLNAKKRLSGKNKTAKTPKRLNGKNA